MLINKERFHRNEIKVISGCVLLLASLFTLTADAQEGTVVIHQQDIKNGVALYGKNNNVYPVTLEVNFDVSNLNSTKGNPIIIVISGESQVKLTELRIDKKDASWKMNYNYTFYQGSIFAEHKKGFGYRLPYKKGTAHRLDQGYGGKFSHKGDSRYSLDFHMAEGTGVYAARAGVVVEIQEGYSEGGNDRSLVDKANFVSILHDDGTFAQYSHLQKSGVLVKIGQKVRAGEKIGLSGATGFATGPHLHFNVVKAKKGGGFQTLPVRFSTKDGIQELEEGQSYIGY